VLIALKKGFNKKSPAGTGTFYKFLKTDYLRLEEELRTGAFPEEDRLPEVRLTLLLLDTVVRDTLRDA